jgi:hypothetical protein
MACMTLFAPPMTMATTKLARVIYCEDAADWKFESSVERNPISMSWVVVTDNDGSRSLQMQWKPSADLR